jgi:hypothetical protein
VASVSPDAASAHFGWLGRFFAIDQPASSAITRTPDGLESDPPGAHRGIEDLEEGHYFDGATRLASSEGT